jgi:hypothetical protein
MPMASPRTPRATGLGAIVFLTFAAACSEPPTKEMHEAQGAIAAARAAGADTYAAPELEAARAALKRSEQAVTARDYRLALGQALDARERAEEAAREAADRKAAARSDAERALAEASAALARARVRIEAASKARAPRRALTTARAGLQDASRTVQESRAALSTGDYLKAKQLLDSVAARLDAVLKGLTPQARPRGARTR